MSITFHLTLISKGPKQNIKVTTVPITSDETRAISQSECSIKHVLLVSAGKIASVKSRYGFDLEPDWLKTRQPGCDWLQHDVD